MPNSKPQYNEIPFDLEKYIKHQQSLIDLEFRAENEKEESAITSLFNVSLRSDDIQMIYNQTLLPFAPKKAVLTDVPIDLPKHNITVRDVVHIRAKYKNDQKCNKNERCRDNDEIEGVVYTVTPDTITISCEQAHLPSFLFVDPNTVSIDIIKKPNKFLHERLSKCLNELAVVWNKRDEILLPGQESELKHILNNLYNNEPTSFSRPHQSILDFSQVDKSYTNALNESQIIALHDAVKLPSLFCLQGPPGTGKTEWLAALCQQLVSTGNRVLFSAATNVAVDNIVQRLQQKRYKSVYNTTKSTESGIQTVYELPSMDSAPLVTQRNMNIIRFGNPARIDPNALASSLDHIVQQNTSSSSAERKELIKLFRLINGINNNANDPAAKQKLNNNTQNTSTFPQNRVSKDDQHRYYTLRREISRLERAESIRTLQAADVIACTLHSTFSRRISSQSYDVVIIDECSQATESSTINAILMAKKSVVLVGDRHQLGPTIMTEDIVGKRGLECSLFERLLNGEEFYKHKYVKHYHALNLPMSSRVSNFMLTQQYRFNYIINNWCSQLFYDGRLVPASQQVCYRVLEQSLSYKDNIENFLNSKGTKFTTDDVFLHNIMKMKHVKNDNITIDQLTEEHAPKTPEHNKDDKLPEQFGKTSQFCQESATDELDDSSIDLTNPFSTKFFDTLLNCKDETEKSRMLLNPFLFIDTNGDIREDNPQDISSLRGPIKSKNDENTKEFSKTNKGEIPIVLSHVEFLLSHGVPPSHILLLSPYRGQVTLLSDAVKANYPTFPINVSTIDAIQGQQQQIVIISLCRSNFHNIVGFLSEYKRLNVAITRAMQQVVLIGDGTTLSSSKLFQSIIDYKYNTYFHHQDYADILGGHLRSVDGTRQSNKGIENRAKNQKCLQDHNQDECNRLLIEISDKWSIRDILLKEQLEKDRIKSEKPLVQLHTSNNSNPQTIELFTSLDDFLTRVVNTTQPLSDLLSLNPLESTDIELIPGTQLKKPYEITQEYANAHTIDKSTPNKIAVVAKPIKQHHYLKTITIPTLHQQKQSQITQYISFFNTLSFTIPVFSKTSTILLNNTDRRTVHSHCDDIYQKYYKKYRKLVASNGNSNILSQLVPTTFTSDIVSMYSISYTLTHQGVEHESGDANNNKYMNYNISLQLKLKEDFLKQRILPALTTRYDAYIDQLLGLIKQYEHEQTQMQSSFLHSDEENTPDSTGDSAVNNTETNNLHNAVSNVKNPFKVEGVHPSVEVYFDKKRFTIDLEDNLLLFDVLQYMKQTHRSNTLKQQQQAKNTAKNAKNQKTVAAKGGYVLGSIGSTSPVSSASSETFNLFQNIIALHTGVYPGDQSLVSANRKIKDDATLFSVLKPLPGGGKKSPLVQVIGVKKFAPSKGPLME